MEMTDIANGKSGIPTEVLGSPHQQRLAAEATGLTADLLESSQTV